MNLRIQLVLDLVGANMLRKENPSVVVVDA